MKKKQYLAGLLTVAMIGTSLALPGNTLQAEAASKAVKKITLPKKATVYVGIKKALKVTKAPKASSAKITWKSSDKKVAAVNSKGVVKGVKAGTVTITASVKGKSSIKSTCKVTVKKPRLIKKLTAGSKQLTLNTGDTRTIKTTITPKNASIKKLKYKSSNTAVASVSSKGKITAKKAGKATVTVRATDGSKKKASIQVTVSEVKAIQPASIKASVSSSNLIAGNSAQITVTPQPANAKMPALVYESSDPFAATVSKDGKITALAQGSTTITVKSAQGNLKTSVDVSVDYDRKNVDKPRVIITNDGEIDDKNSYVHLLYYANEIDLVGLVQTSSFAHWAGSPTAPDSADSMGQSGKKPWAWPGTDWQNEFIDSYARIYPNLRVHDPNYPTPNYLKSVVRIGNIGYKGDMENDTAGSEHIKKLILDDVEGPLFITAWGGLNTASKALLSIYEQYGSKPEWEAIRQKIYSKVRIYMWGGQDDTYNQVVAAYYPELICMDVKQSQALGWSWDDANTNGKHAIPEELSGAWLQKNIDSGHGALLDWYVTFGDGTHVEGENPSFQFGEDDKFLDGTFVNGMKKRNRYDFCGEGDTPTYLSFFDTGLRSLEQYEWGSIVGRFKREEGKTNEKGEAITNYYIPQNDYVDLGYGMDSYDSGARWVPYIMRDFAARADWGITPKYEDANHRPDISIKEGLAVDAKPGERVYLNAETSDPDGDSVSVQWFNYMEAGTYKSSQDTDAEKPSAIAIRDGGARMSFIVPEDAKDGDTIHMIAKATDDGEHNLSYYQRVIVTVSENGINRPASITASVDSDQIVAGNTAQIKVTPEPADAELPALIYESSDPLAATVSKDGKITALAQGSTTITVKSVHGDLKASVDVTVDYDRQKVDKPRVIITNDGEIDDKNSYVHLLYYANEIDLVGLVQTSSFAHWAGSPTAPDSADSMGQSGKKPWAWPGTDWQNEFIDSYSRIYPNLKVHDPNYPTPNYLKSVVRIGNIGYKGDMENDTAGSEHIKKLILDDVEGPLFITAWGGLNTASKALLSIYEQYGSKPEWEAIRQKIYSKVRIYMWGGQDDTYDQVVAAYYPELICMDVKQSQALGWSWDDANTNGKHAIPEELSGAWLQKNIDSGHGALLDWYVTFGDGTHVEGENPSFQFGEDDKFLNGTFVNGMKKRNRYDFCGEGDTPTYLSFFDTGLGALEHYEYGSIVGRFKKEEGKTNANGEAITNYYIPQNDYVDLGYGMDSYDSGARWVPYIMRDFAARADWGITPNYEDANHRPDISIKEGLTVDAKPGDRVYLNAETSDPDGDTVSVQWFNYIEAGTYRSSQDEAPGKPSSIAISGGGSHARMSFVVPEDAKKGDTIHMIAKATDNGEHNLSYYQRVIITVSESGSDQPAGIASSEGSEQSASGDSAQVKNAASPAEEDAKGGEQTSAGPEDSKQPIEAEDAKQADQTDPQEEAAQTDSNVILEDLQTPEGEAAP